MKKKLIVLFFLLFSACNTKTSIGNSDKYSLPGTAFVDALLTRDTSYLKNTLDSVSIKYVSLYSVPKIKSNDDIHYKLVISRENVDGLIVYRYTISFPWKDAIMLYLVRNGNKWSLLPVYMLSKRFSSLKLQGVVLYYPDSIETQKIRKIGDWLRRFKQDICHGCNGCCADSIIYIYDPSGKPYYVFGEMGENSGNLYKRGWCYTKVPFDTFGIMEALLDRNKYLYSIVKGYYLYHYTKHRVLGYDVGDWLKSEFLSSSIRYFPPDLIQNMIFYKPLSGALGYVFIDYLFNERNLKMNTVKKKLFSITPELKRIVDNNGSNILFLRKHVENVVNDNFTSVFLELGKFIMTHYKDISKQPDTIRFIRDKKRNITFVLSSRYGTTGESVVHLFGMWMDSLDFFHKPYYTFLIVPAWLADSFRTVLTPANSYWTALYEFKKTESVIKEMKREYTVYLVSNFIKTYSVQQKQLPLWISLGLPVYFQRGGECRIDDYHDIIKLGESGVEHFYETALGDISPRVSILLSYKMICIIDHLHPGAVNKLLEKSISNMSFSTTYKEVTAHDLSEVFRAWKAYVKDTLFFRVSRK